MELEHQVCTLELAKRLKEFSMRQDTHFMWEGILQDVDRIRYTVKRFHDNHNPVRYAAFTVAELDQLLPTNIELKGNTGQLRIEPIDRGGRRHYEVGYWIATDFLIQPMRDFNPADARAKMLIYLVENNLITLEHSHQGT